MNRQRLIKGLLRLFAVSVILTAVLALAPDREVKATPDVCIQNYGFCLYSCASYPPGSPQQQECEATCELYYWGCDAITTDELPAPYPVIDHSRSACLHGCLQCNNLGDLEEQLVCYEACWNWCNDTYPKP